MKAQTYALKKQREAETADLNDISTIIFSFAKDQGYPNPPEANGKIPETAAVSSALKLKTVMKKRRSEP